MADDTGDEGVEIPAKRYTAQRGIAPSHRNPPREPIAISNENGTSVTAFTRDFPASILRLERTGKPPVDFNMSLPVAALERFATLLRSYNLPMEDAEIIIEGFQRWCEISDKTANATVFKKMHHEWIEKLSEPADMSRVQRIDALAGLADATAKTFPLIQAAISKPSIS